LRVVLLDHDIYRVGVRQMLRTVVEHEVVGEASAPQAALEIVTAAAADVVVLDPILWGRRGAAPIHVIRRCAPHSRIFVLTEDGPIRNVVDALTAGATGYALKGDSVEEILDGLRQVKEGQRYLAPTLIPRLLRRLKRDRGARGVLRPLQSFA